MCPCDKLMVTKSVMCRQNTGSSLYAGMIYMSELCDLTHKKEKDTTTGLKIREKTVSVQRKTIAQDH